MRASSLSNPKVIDLLNRHFVPVYVSNEDYAKDGPAPAEEKAERQRVYREALQAKLSAGTVHVYVLDPAGRCIDSQHVATASKVEELTAMLERTVARLKTPAGPPLVAPAAQSAPAKGAPDDLLLHLTARYLRRQGDELVVPSVALGTTRAGSWGAYPGENWVRLGRAEWARLLPAGETRPGSSWEIDAATGAKILNCFYPPTENNDVRKNKILEQALKATVLDTRDGVTRARLDGRLKMKHPFYHKDDDQVVETAVVGLMEFDPAGKKVRSFKLVSDDARYGNRPFGVAVWSVP